MRINCRISMSWKVLNGSRHPLFMHAFYIGLNEFTYKLRRCPKGTDPNDRIVRIYINISYGCKVHIQAKLLQHLSSPLSGFYRQFRLTCSSESHITIHICCIRYASNKPAFLIRSNPYGYRYIQVVQQCRCTNCIIDCLELITKQDDSARS